MLNHQVKFTILSIAILLMLICPFLYANNTGSKYCVLFKDKQAHSFDPYTYFDTKAIERRLTNNYPVKHLTDWPVNENYIQEIENIADSLCGISRWMNAAFVLASHHQIKQIELLPYVKNIIKMACNQVPLAINNNLKYLDYNDFLTPEYSELLINQTERMKGSLFTDRDINGKNIRIAVFDAGFPTVDINPAFDHIRAENKIIKTWDFLKNKDNVYSHSAHGTMVLSCIAGIIDNSTDGIIKTKMGLATGAEFLLARTESGVFEPYSEEENWLAAAEWADKNGAHIISSSLGYTHNRYFPKDMDGTKSLVAKAANMAAAKGILVINAAGNDGSGNWKYINTPADADSVLAVGGTDAETDFHIPFSSFGPTADMRLKPNVCAYGYAVVAGKRGLDIAHGTSFSTPLVTGFAACAWQTRPTLTSMELFQEIEKSGDLHPYFDYAHGFGVPQATYFVKRLKTSTTPSFKLVFSDEQLKVLIDKKYFHEDYIDQNKLLYYHIENKMGYLERYYIISVYQYDVLNFMLSEFTKGNILRVHFDGYTEEYKF